jgi:hypothetical protein
VLGGCAALQLELLFEPVFALRKPFLAVTRDRFRVCLALFPERLACLAEALAALGLCAKTLGQLVAPRLALELVFCGVDLCRLFEDLLGDLLVAAVCVVGG